MRTSVVFLLSGTPMGVLSRGLIFSGSTEKKKVAAVLSLNVTVNNCDQDVK